MTQILLMDWLFNPELRFQMCTDAVLYLTGSGSWAWAPSSRRGNVRPRTLAMIGPLIIRPWSSIIEVVLDMRLACSCC